MTPSEIGETFQVPEAITYTRASAHPADASPPGDVAAALQDIPLATTLTHPLEGTTQRDIAAGSAD